MQEKIKCAPNIQWVVEVDRIILIHPSRKKGITLLYPDCAIWDLISRGYLFHQVCTMISSICQIDLKEAENLIKK